MGFLRFVILFFIIIFFQISGNAQDTLIVLASEVIVESQWIRTDSSRFVAHVKLSNQKRISLRNTSLADVFRTVPSILNFERNNLSVEDRISVRRSGWQSVFGVRGLRLFYEG